MDPKYHNHGNMQDYFWFKGKYELTKILLHKYVRKKSKILVIGVGDGQELKEIKPYGKVTINDIDEQAIANIPKQMYDDVIIGDATTANFKKDYYDTIILMDVLEHIQHDKQAIRNLKSALRYGGKMIISVPLHQNIYGEHDIAADHYRRYSTKQIKALLEDNKLTIKRITHWNTILAGAIIAYRLIKKMKKTKDVDYMPIPALISDILYITYWLENKAISKNFNLPLGISLVCVVVK